MVLHSMAALVQENLEKALGLLADYSEAGFNEVQDLEAQVDHYEDKIGLRICIDVFFILPFRSAKTVLRRYRRVF